VYIVLTFLLIKVATVISFSHVDQQYVRAQTLFLAHNSPIFPAKAKRVGMVEGGFAQMILGMSQTPGSEDGAISTKAPSYKVARKDGGDSGAGMSPALRSRVFVKNTVSLCTQPEVTAAGGKIYDLSDAAEPNGLSETFAQSSFGFCRSPYQ